MGRLREYFVYARGVSVVEFPLSRVRAMVVVRGLPSAAPRAAVAGAGQGRRAGAGVVAGEELEQPAGCRFRVLGVGVHEYVGAQS